VLKSATGWHIEVVFDAYLTGGPERSVSIDNVNVVYTSKEETADNYIERR
jgi:predicted RNA-binding protein with PIN domain